VDRHNGWLALGASDGAIWLYRAACWRIFGGVNSNSATCLGMITGARLACLAALARIMAARHGAPTNA